MKLTACLVYNAFLVAGAAHLIINHDWSKWTMLLAILLMIGPKEG